jgi:putative transposase
VGFRFPAEIISHAVWLYYRFALSFRDVSELLLARGVVVSHETIRQWTRKFGQTYANGLRRRRPRPGDKWHLDEVVITINGVQHYWWRAVDQGGVCLDVLVQRRRKRQGGEEVLPRAAHGPAVRTPGARDGQARLLPGRPPGMLSAAEHRRWKYLNNRAENSHQPIRVRERVMKRFHCGGQAQRFCFAHGVIASHFRPGRHLMSGTQWRAEITERFTVWNEVAGVSIAA